MLGLRQWPTKIAAVSSSLRNRTQWPVSRKMPVAFFFQQALTKEYREERRLRFTPLEMYELVQDVNDYQNYVPWCTGSRVLPGKRLLYAKDGTALPALPPHLRSTNNTMCTHRRATLQVGFSQFQNVSYLSDVYCWEGVECTRRHQSAVRVVEARAADADLFDLLVSRWTFFDVNRPANNEHQKVSPACLVEFDIKFRFKSILHAQASQLFFSQVCQAMVQAFEKRAAVRYRRF